MLHKKAHVILKNEHVWIGRPCHPDIPQIGYTHYEPTESSEKRLESLLARWPGAMHVMRERKGVDDVIDIVEYQYGVEVE